MTRLWNAARPLCFAGPCLFLACDSTPPKSADEYVGSWTAQTVAETTCGGEGEQSFESRMILASDGTGTVDLFVWFNDSFVCTAVYEEFDVVSYELGEDGTLELVLHDEPGATDWIPATCSDFESGLLCDFESFSFNDEGVVTRTFTLD